MFPKALLVVLASSALVFSQAPSPAPPIPGPPAPPPISISQCNTANAQCCSTTTTTSTPGATTLAGLLGIVIQDLSLLIGLQCSPLSVGNLLGGTNCAQQPVCCQNITSNGLINFGCSPISL